LYRVLSDTLGIQLATWHSGCQYVRKNCRVLPLCFSQLLQAIKAEGQRVWYRCWWI